MIQHWHQGWLQIGLPNFDGILFSALGPQYNASSSAFISNLGQIEKFFFSISALDS
jgi:hypothetical protein